MLLPEPVVCAFDFIALEFIAFAWCFECLVIFAGFVSSFATLAPGVDALPVFMVCANAAGEATIRAVIKIPGIVSFIEASIVERLNNSKVR